MSERREKYHAGQKPAGDVTITCDQAIRRLVTWGYIVTIGPTASELFPYHLVVYRPGNDPLVDQRCDNFAPKLLKAARRYPDGR